MSTQQQNIDKLARFMGWEKVTCNKEKSYWEWVEGWTPEMQKKYECFCVAKCSDGVNVPVSCTWNPYESEDDFRMVLEKVIEDKDLRYSFCESFGHGTEISIYHYLEATLKQRMDAAIKVISDSQKPE